MNSVSFPWGTAVRYGHENNGTWSPWAGDPVAFRDAWEVWSALMLPHHCRRVWSPNVLYPGSAERVNVIGIDGYSRQDNGYPMPAELCGPTIAAVERSASRSGSRSRRAAIRR